MPTAASGTLVHCSVDACVRTPARKPGREMDKAGGEQLDMSSHSAKRHRRTSASSHRQLISCSAVYLKPRAPSSASWKTMSHSRCAIALIKGYVDAPVLGEYIYVFVKRCHILVVPVIRP